MDKQFNINLLFGVYLNELSINYDVGNAEKVILVSQKYEGNTAEVIAYGIDEICSTLRTLQNLKSLFIVREDDDGVNISSLSLRQFMKKYSSANDTTYCHNYNEALEHKCQAQLGRA